MPPERFLSSVGWSLNGLINQGPRFRQIPRVSVSDNNLEMTIRHHENSGAPLVIEGISEHHAWPTAMFDIQWLRNNSKQQIQVRNVRNRLDLEVTFTEFLDHIKSIPHSASADETSRWYAKDVECPQEWKKWLDATPLIPRFLCPHGPADIMQNLPESARVETLMCYLGIGDTFTPCHKDLCASFGHNLMCYTEDDASAFWFMTDSSAAFSMATYFQSLGQELDLECHAMSIEEFAAAPCEIYITEQKAGDLVLVPPRSCHQVINHGGLTVKMSWSRLSIRSTQVALHHELPIYRRVCRAETYRIKSTIHHTLRRNTALLEDLTRSTTFHEEFRRQLANDMQKLLDLFREIILDECYPDAELLDHVIRDFNHNVYDTEGYPAFSCDFCGSDIFVSFFCCKDCSLSAQGTSSVNDSLHICPGCYAEGRTCGCGRHMEPVQCWPLQILYGDHDRAVRALKSVGVVTFNEVGDHSVLDSNATGIFEAGMTIRQWRTASTANKGISLCYANAQPHGAHRDVILPCKKCRKGRCFVHLAQAGVHSSEAITYYKRSLDPSSWHDFHVARKEIVLSDKETILAAEVSGDKSPFPMGQTLAVAASLFPHCQPLNITHIKLGWYDRLKSHGVPVAAQDPSAAMDMSFPRDSDEWGSPLSESCLEDSASSTLVGPETSPLDAGPIKSERTTSQPSAGAVVMASTKRKRTPSVIFDGIVPPERKRRITTHSPPSPHSYERNRAPKSTQSSTTIFDGSLVQVISRIDALTTTITEQNRKIEVLVQNNTVLRDEVRNLSQDLKLSKRDLLRVEHTVSRMTAELKGRFDRMLETSENRMQGPIDRLLEELGRIRPNPPTSVPVPGGMTPLPSNTPYVHDPGAGGGGWSSRDEYGLTEPNRPHYQENWEQHEYPNKHGRGGFRGFRGRARGSRGAYYAGHRPSGQRPYFPASWEGHRTAQAQGNPVTPAQIPVPTSVPVSADKLQHGDAYHSQGHAPPPSQHPHTPSHSHSNFHSHHAYPYTHPTETTPTRYPRPPSHSHTHAHSLSYSHSRTHAENARDGEPSQHLSASQQYSYERVGEYTNDNWHCVPTWERERAARPAGAADPPNADADANVDADADADRHRRAPHSFDERRDPPASPTQSDEKPRWLFTPSDGGDEQHRGHTRPHSQSRSLSLSRSASWGSNGAGAGASRAHVGNRHAADDVRRGRG